MNDNDIEPWIKYIQGAVFALRCACGTHSFHGDPLARGYSEWSSRATQALRGVLPYLLHPVPSCDSTTYIWLNRGYKPLGLPGLHGGWVNYAAYSWLHVSLTDPRIAPLLQVCKASSDGRIGKAAFWFYQDNTAPWYSKADSLRLLKILENFLTTLGHDVPDR